MSTQPPASTCASEMDDFINRVQDLPAELFNNILELVFTLDSDNGPLLNKAYKPPVQLQVDRANGKRFAAQYYSTKMFILSAADLDLFAKFLKSLPRDQRLLIKRFHVTRTPDNKYRRLGEPMNDYILGVCETLRKDCAKDDDLGAEEKVLESDAAISTSTLVDYGKGCLKGELSWDFW